MVSDQSLCYPLRLIEFESWPYLPTLANFYGLGILQTFDTVLAIICATGQMCIVAHGQI